MASTLPPSNTRPMVGYKTLTSQSQNPLERLAPMNSLEDPYGSGQRQVPGGSGAEGRKRKYAYDDGEVEQEDTARQAGTARRGGQAGRGGRGSARVHGGAGSGRKGAMYRPHGRALEIGAPREKDANLFTVCQVKTYTYPNSKLGRTRSLVFLLLSISALPGVSLAGPTLSLRKARLGQLV